MSAAAAAARQTPAPKPSPETFKRRQNGFTPLAHKYMYDLMRIIGPKVDLACVLFVLTETDGANQVPKSRPLSSAEFAWFAHEKDVRTVQYALEDLLVRKVLVREYAGRRGFYRYSAPVETWATLDDYVERKRPASAEGLDSGEENENSQRINFRSVSVSPGVPTKALRLDTQPERVQYECTGAASIQHGIENGVLHVKIEPKQPVAKPAIEQPAAPANGASNGTSNGHAKLPSSYDMHFRVAWAEAGLFGSDWQHKEAEKQWNQLEIAEQMAAVQNVRDKTLSGEFARYKPLPPNFFRKGMWQVPAQTKNQDAKKQESRKELFDWARAMDAKATRT